MVQDFDNFWSLMKRGHKIGAPYPVFKEITDGEIDALAMKYGGNV